MFYKKGKASFYLRVLGWSRRDHVLQDRLHLMKPSPGGGSRAGSGLELGSHQSTASNGPVSGEGGATEMTMPVSMAGLILFKEQTQWVHLSGRGKEKIDLRRFCCRAGAMAEPELTHSH